MNKNKTFQKKRISGNGNKESVPGSLVTSGRNPFEEAAQTSELSYGVYMMERNLLNRRRQDIQERLDNNERVTKNEAAAAAKISPKKAASKRMIKVSRLHGESSSSIR